jgi:hypothetical protein
MSKIQLLKSAVWNDASELGPTLSFDNKMKLRIPDQSTWIKWREDPEKNIPHCILQYLHGKYGDEMELRCPEERYLVGESVIVDDISKDGARILITKHMQSELAFAVTRTDVVAFNKTDFILQGQPYEYRSCLREMVCCIASSTSDHRDYDQSAHNHCKHDNCHSLNRHRYTRFPPSWSWKVSESSTPT